MDAAAPDAASSAQTSAGPGPVPGHDRPLPETDPLSSVYWAAAARGELLIQTCDSCGNNQFYPRAVCTTCGQTPRWLQASGDGTVYTFTIVRQHGMSPFREEVPYVIAMIDLAEGPRLMSRITDCDVDDVHVGMAVKAYLVPAAPDIGVHYWRPAAAQQGSQP
jgi:uncharacterized OB-fold protein